MRMLLRSSCIGPVILENDDMAHSRVGVKFRKALTVRLENPLEVRNRKFRHQPIMPRTFNQHFMKTDTVHARFARSKAAGQTELTLRRKHGKLVDNGTEYPPSLSPARRKRSSAVRASFPGQNGQVARNGAAGVRFPADTRSPPRLARSGAIITDSPVILFSRISDMPSHLQIDYFSTLTLPGAMIFSAAGPAMSSMTLPSRHGRVGG